MKDAYYFPHDAGARNDPEMIRLKRIKGFEGIGIYWHIVEMLREANEDGYKIKCLRMEDIAYDGHFDVDMFSVLTEDVGLLKTDGEWFWSSSLIRRMKPLDEKRRLLSEAGKRGGRPPKEREVKATLSKNESQVKATPKGRPKPAESNKKRVEERRREEKGSGSAHAGSNNDIDTKGGDTAKNPNKIQEVNMSRESLKTQTRVLGDILYKHFDHMGQHWCDDISSKFRLEFGEKLNLEALFTEIGVNYENNEDKCRPGREYSHIRSWCRNAVAKGEFLLNPEEGKPKSRAHMGNHERNKAAIEKGVARVKSKYLAGEA